jgi:bifunctional ADP-heptose synthase (sugar kinase/adenylyltransferase)
MLTDENLQEILERLPGLKIGVVGDLFLDRYLEIDPALTESSIETGLEAYQVVRVRPSPGAAGTVINNLVALGVQEVRVISFTGDDGEGYELRRALNDLGRVDSRTVVLAANRRTPTYTKPLVCAVGEPPRELNRLDIKNRTPLPRPTEDALIQALEEVVPAVDALVVSDQVAEADCGVVTQKVRDCLAVLGASHPDKLILADSRAHIGFFRAASLKPNESECVRSVGGGISIEDAAGRLAERADRPVFCTCGGRGILLVDPRYADEEPRQIAGYPVMGPIDIVGAGDSTSAAIACAVATRAELPVAAAFGCLVASITIQQIGTTGTATAKQVWERWREVRAMQN